MSDLRIENALLFLVLVEAWAKKGLGYYIVVFYRKFFGVCIGVEENYCFLPAD